MALALVMPSVLRPTRRFSRLCEKSTRLSLSCEDDKPLSVLSALVSELPPRSPITAVLSTLAGWSPVEEGLGSESRVESDSRVVDNFGFAVDMLGLVVCRDATELGAA